MLPHEQQLLEQFLQRVNAASGVPQDPQAQALIQQRLAPQPDAAYLLVQRALLLEQALESAQQQIDQLEHKVQQQAQSAQPATSFLGGRLDTRFGRNPEPEAASYIPASASPSYANATSSNWRQRWFGAPPTSAAPATPYTQAAPSAAAPLGGAGSSWLGSAASAAAGVAGGMFLFNGLERMLGNHTGADGQANSLLHEHAAAQPSENLASNDPSHSALAQDAGADSVQDTGSANEDSGGSFFDDSGDWDA